MLNMLVSCMKALKLKLYNHFRVKLEWIHTIKTVPAASSYSLNMISIYKL